MEVPRTFTNGLTSSYTHSHNDPWFHSPCKLLYRVDLSDTFLFHISNRCQWVVELSYPFQRVFQHWLCCDCHHYYCHWVLVALSFCGSFPIMHIVDLGWKLPVKLFPWLASVTSLPSLTIFVQILSEAKPLIMVSLSILFHVSPSGYSPSFTSRRALVWKSYRLMDTWKSLEFHNCNQSIGFRWDVFFKRVKYLLTWFLLVSVIFPSVSHLSTNSIPVSPDQ